MNRLCLAIGLVGMLGCTHTKPSESPAIVKTTDTNPLPPAHDAPAIVPPVTPSRTDIANAPTPPKDLPAFGGKVDAASSNKAHDLAIDALKTLTGSSESDAVVTATAAVKADPGSALARYAIACVAGDEAFKLAQLTPLTTAIACADCNDVVRNLAHDDDDGCELPDKVRALAGAVKPAPQRAAAEALMATLGDGDPSHAAAFFKAPSVELFVTCSVCDGKAGDQLTKTSGAKLLSKFAAQVTNAKAEDGMGDIIRSGGMRCTADCCSVRVGVLQHNHDFFSKLCFKPGTDQVRRVEIISGG